MSPTVTRASGAVAHLLTPNAVTKQTDRITCGRMGLLSEHMVGLSVYLNSEQSRTSIATGRKTELKMCLAQVTGTQPATQFWLIQRSGLL